MAKGDSVTVSCPHCGRASAYTLRNENVNQVDTCRHRSKTFTIRITGGRVTDVRK
jgi:4-hydroxy-3-methylbut-2-en-1-yl diphosphate synthase IspG/GcpE